MSNIELPKKTEAVTNRVMGISGHNGSYSIEQSAEANRWFDQISKSENKPWAGANIDGLSIGTSIDELNANPQWNWTVEKRQAFDDEGLIVEDSFFNRRSDTKKHLGHVGKEYKVVQNTEATEWFRPFFESGLAMFESAGVYRGGKACWVMARMAGQPIMAVKDDPILPYMAFRFGHDGGHGISIFPTSYRLFCLNCMPALSADAKQYGIKLNHRGNVHEVLDTVQEVTMQAYQGMKDVEEQLKLLSNRSVVNQASLEKYFRQALKLPFADPNQIWTDEKEYLKYITQGKRALDAVFNAYEEERSTLPPAAQDTMYHALNGVTRYLTHGKGEQSEGNRWWDNLFGAGHSTQMRSLELALAA